MEKTRLKKARENIILWKKYLYKYPQAVFPNEDFVRTNGQRMCEEVEMADVNMLEIEIEKPVFRKGVAQ